MKKFAATILAAIILITSVYPVSKTSMLINTAQKKTSACCHAVPKACKKAKHSSQKDNTGRQCDTGSCNPFSICNYFPVVTPVFPVSPVAYYIIVNNKWSHFNETIFPDYHSGCWHPPEIV